MSRFRLFPTSEQEFGLLGHGSHARFVWNLALEQQQMWRPGRGPSPSFAARCRQLAEARGAEPWLAAGSSIVQQQALRDLDRAFSNFFGGSHRYPTWRSARSHEGFRIVGAQALRVRTINHRWSSVLIPKVGWVKVRRSRDMPEWKSYRITRDRSGRWHVAFASIPAPIPAPGCGEIVGVDRGVIVSAALSTGEKTSPAGLRAKQAERLVRLQRRLARAKRGSNRRKAVVGKIAVLRARETDRRKDWVEKTSTDLARRFDLIGVENLKVASMTRSARGTLAAPGRNVRQKAGLNRGILKAGWTLLLTRLEHKASGRVVKVDPAYTSQMCSACGQVDANSRESQALFVCTACAFAEHADVNAACNIRDRAASTASTIATSTTAAGHAVAGRRDMGDLARSVKRQPLTGQPQPSQAA